MIYNTFTIRLTDEYELFLFALSAGYLSLLLPGVEMTPNTIRSLDIKSAELVKTFMGIATSEIDNYIATLISDSPDGLTDALAHRKTAVESILRKILHENMNTVKRLAIGSTISQAQLLKNAHGPFGLLMQQKVSKIDFKVSDSSGRKWHAGVLMKTVMRDFAYQSWIDAQAMKCMASGDDLMEAKGKVFSLLGTVGYESFDAVRHLVFHPNSSAEMVPYVQT